MKKIKRIFTILLGTFIILASTSCFKKDSPKTDDDTPDVKEDEIALVEKGEYITSKIGYEAKYLGTVKRNIPTTTKDEGFSLIGYPTYGEDFLDANTNELRQKIIDEASYLTSKDTKNAGGGGYNAFDSEGNLLLKTTKTNSDGTTEVVTTNVLDKNNNPRKLYKHTASVGMYYGDIKNSEPAIIKEVTIAPRGYTLGYSVTGLYQAPGEISKIEISKEDMEKTGGITVYIGQALFNGQNNNIWKERTLCRMPIILNTLIIDKTTATYNEVTNNYEAYLGSFLGGAIYLGHEETTFSVVISGALSYSHFILGYTTEEEFNNNKSSSVPYFDLEVCEKGVLHSGAKKYVEEFSYSDLYNAGVLWDKIANVSTKYKAQGIVFLYDPFVAAGAAVAFPGRNSVNCPGNWMTSSLNYNEFVRQGAWGNIHEYNHNFQGFGVGDGGEVTNNAISLVSYSLYTKISSNRNVNSASENLSGWNRYTSATWSLRDITENIYDNGKKGLSIYSTFLHNFGQEIFMDSVINQKGQESVDNWALSQMNASKYDMSYYYDLIGLPLSQSIKDEAKKNNYPMFVPVSSIYQTGRSIMKNGKVEYITTQQPYNIAYGEEFIFDLSKYEIVDGKKISGSIVIPSGFSYKIKNISSPANGTITKIDDYKYKYIPSIKSSSGDIIVTLEIIKDDGAFSVLDVNLCLSFLQTHEINKYQLDRTTYKYDSSVYQSAKDAFLSSYDGYSNKVEGINDNTHTSGRVVQDCSAEVWLENAGISNQIIEIKGKYKINSTDKYRISLRGRYNCALFVSLDGKNYSLAAEYTNNSSSSADFPKLDGTYKDYTLEENSWLYFKAVMLCVGTGRNNFIGVGFNKTSSKEIEKVNAYNLRYIEDEEVFNPSYLYEREYKYNYQDNKKYEIKDLVNIENYSPWDSNEHILSNLLDGKYDTWIHTNYDASEDKPLILDLDLGSVVDVNRINIYTQQRSDPHYPKAFSLYGSLDGVNYNLVSKFDDTTLKGNKITCDFNDTKLRYFRLNITKSSYRYIIISEIEMENIFEIKGGYHISLNDDNVLLYGSWNKTSTIQSFMNAYQGDKNDYIEFEFTGERFAFLAPSKVANEFEVIIDGNKEYSIIINKQDYLGPVFISNKLDNKKHKVTIKALGVCYIDSIVYW